ncbi:pneumococcal-type histidine triad protein [Streptococcus hillyeri]|uniref:pneumococcal-type histidine triad protein n=1 Tax=Streptococcus hillyeri TaxID=2282420 RepID=UPI0034E21DBF
MKKKTIYFSSAAALLLASHIAIYYVGTHQAQQTNRENEVAYIDQRQSTSPVSKNKTMEQINAEEGISAEQIVIKITDQGYVTSHGDHFHFYNGKVPYDAIISEELLMTDPNYHFNEADVVNEIQDGYIIKVNGNYYVYLKPNSKKKNIRSKEEIAEQVALGTKEAKERGKSHHLTQPEKMAISKAKQEGRYTTDDGYVFNPTDIIDDFGDAYLVPHGNHFHYIPKKDLSPRELAEAQQYWNQKNGKSNVSKNTSVLAPSYYTPSGTGQTGPIPPSSIIKPLLSYNKDFNNKSFDELLSQLHQLDKKYRHVEEDGLIFEPTQVTGVNHFGYIIPHGDHFHIIPRNQLSELEVILADRFLSGQRQGTALIPEKIIPNKSPSTDKSHQFLGHTIVAYGKGLDGKPYDTSDHYIFSKESIVSVDKSGVTAKHEEHYHYIGFGELEQSELDQVTEWLSSQNQLNQLKAIFDNTQAGDTPVFEAKKVSKKHISNGKVGYIITRDGKDYFYSRDELDLTQIAFAEQELMLQDSSHYQYDIAQSDIAPKLAVAVSSLPMHAGNATYDTGNSFVIPHIDHIHVVPYSWLTPDQIATIKYVMLHPEVRPDIWSNPGHEESPTVIANVTPKEQRDSLQNWQITYSTEELQAAKQAGRYTEPDGYIFHPSDILAKGTFVWRNNSFSIPRANGKSLRTIRKEDLSDAEWQESQELLKQKQEKSTSQTESSTKPKETTTETVSALVAPKTTEPVSSTEEAPQVTTPSETSEEPTPSDPFFEGLPDYGLDQETLEEHINKIAQIANRDRKFLIFLPEGVQFYDDNGKLVLYDIKTLEKIN